ncbi:dTDP-4-dehydrorhamnose reductase [Candidatus Nitrosotalea sp. TS]|uniref:dTDP-4-dehydrorhamnose reductase n=1 Tax=Candidatus Nitrosotalea sp. TS TaxID=2341020 RepID=UPI00140DE304|nr:dTDP-4-dehydrorhamnose reductase [Candidatus Nitrosotalea sp. TS]NHI03649.1 dTDP-4-dehydrorhamnose reductase [Candidatus Nitrosotalea sp. TS]
MKFLVTGSAGLVGRQVIKDLLQSYTQVYSCYNNSKPEDGIATHLDLTSPDGIIKVIESTRPDVIIHLAAMTNVDLCETQKDLATKINAKATAVIAEQAKKLGAFLVYVSTDYVFDGEKGMKIESDNTESIDHYGKSKLEGEKAVEEIATKWCIARTSTPYGIHPKKKSFPIFIAENLKSGIPLDIITDQYTSPTYVPNLSRMLIEISSRKIQGILHVSGATRVSRYDMAMMVADKLNLDKKLLRPTSMGNMNWTAKRPRDSSLDISKAASLLKEKPMTVQQGLDLFVEQMKQKPN